MIMTLVNIGRNKGVGNKGVVEPFNKKRLQGLELIPDVQNNLILKCIVFLVFNYELWIPLQYALRVLIRTF